jgi:carboxypeptidase C (cathepsin A)
MEKLSEEVESIALAFPSNDNRAERIRELAKKISVLEHQLTEETGITNNQIERLRAVLIILSAKIKDEERQIAYNELDNILVEIANYHKQSLTEETEEGLEAATKEYILRAGLDCYLSQIVEDVLDFIFTTYILIKREK